MKNFILCILLVVLLLGVFIAPIIMLSNLDENLHIRFEKVQVIEMACMPWETGLAKCGSLRVTRPILLVKCSLPSLILLALKTSMTMRLSQLRSNDLAARPRLRAPVFQHNIQVQ